VGRPTLLDPDIIAAVVGYLETGIPFKYACEAEGLSEKVAYEWCRRGEAGESPYNQFSSAVTRARARGAIHLHGKVERGGAGSHSAQFLLERRFRDEYGNVQKIEHAGHDGGAVKIEAKAIADLSDEELLKLAGPQP